MIELLAVISVLIWVCLLFRQMNHHGFLVLLVWLLVTPVVSNLIENPDRNPFFPPPPSSEEEVVQRPTTKRQIQAESFRNETTSIRVGELLEPNRILFGAFFLLFLGQSLLRRRHLLSLDRTEIWMMIFALIVLTNVITLSIRYALNARIAVDAFIVPFLAYFTARRLVSDEHRFNQLARIIAYLGCFLIVLGIIESVLHPLSHRVQGPFRTRDYLYVVMMVVFFMVAIDAVGRWLKYRPVLPWWVHVFVGIGSPAIILLTLTRGNWAGFLAGVWAFAFFGRKLLPHRQKLVAVGLGVGLLPIILIGAVELSETELLRDRIGNLRTIESRLATYALVLEAGIKNPVFGIGISNLRNYLLDSWVRGESLGSPHSSYLAIFAELGALALIAYLAIMWSICETGLRIFRREKSQRDRWRGIAIVAMLAGYLIPGLFTHLVYHPILLHVYLFTCIGAIAGRYGLSRSKVLDQPVSIAAKQPFYSELASSK